jgi:hypothetical protein
MAPPMGPLLRCSWGALDTLLAAGRGAHPALGLSSGPVWDCFGRTPKVSGADMGRKLPGPELREVLDRSCSFTHGLQPKSKTGPGSSVRRRDVHCITREFGAPVRGAVGIRDPGMSGYIRVSSVFGIRVCPGPGYTGFRVNPGASGPLQEFRPCPSVRPMSELVGFHSGIIYSAYCCLCP